MKSIKILFIHGYGSMENSIASQEIQRKIGARAQVIAPQFSNDFSIFENLLYNIQLANDVVRDKSIDLLIGSSMGGFTAMQTDNIIPKILINPCMLPTEIIETGIFGEMDLIVKEKFREMEMREVSVREKELSYSLFATNDELFSYKERFEKLYDPAKRGVSHNLCK